MAGYLAAAPVLTARRVGLMPPQVRDVSVTVDLATHGIDIIRYVTDKETVRVTIRDGNALHPLNHEDYAVVFMELDGGILGVVEAI